jgi:hypothetical protein
MSLWFGFGQKGITIGIMSNVVFMIELTLEDVTIGFGLFLPFLPGHS